MCTNNSLFFSYKYMETSHIRFVPYTSYIISVFFSLLYLYVCFLCLSLSLFLSSTPSYSYSVSLSISLSLSLSLSLFLSLSLSLSYTPSISSSTSSYSSCSSLNTLSSAFQYPLPLASNIRLSILRKASGFASFRVAAISLSSA